MSIRVGINGFGRIGKGCIRAILESSPELELVAINSTRDPAMLAHLLQYDSVYRKFSMNVEYSEKSLFFDGKEIPLLADRNPENLDWSKHDVDIVLEATGSFNSKEEAEKHLGGSVKKVVITAPAKNVDNTIVMGVNEKNYDASKDHVISNASCTTNCLAPVAKVLNDKFGIEKGLMTTIHAYTNDQKVLDISHSDLRRARAAAVSMIPTTTGAAKAVSLVLPELEGKLNGFAVRIPTYTVSAVDLVTTLQKPVTKEEINQALKEASTGELQGILGYSELPLVSIDYSGSSYSSIVDGLSTTVIGENMVKTFS